MFGKTDIYRYAVDGYGEFVADPLALRRDTLIISAGRCWEWAKRAKEFEGKLAAVADEVGEKADAERAEWSARQAELEGWLVNVAFQAFKLEPIDKDGRGVTELAGLQLLYDFLAWLEEKKAPPGS